jgi:hypothetical protein
VAGILTAYLQTIGISKDEDPYLVITLDRTDEADNSPKIVFKASLYQRRFKVERYGKL